MLFGDLVYGDGDTLDKFSEGVPKPLFPLLGQTFGGFAGVNKRIYGGLPKQKVAGSNPIARSSII